MKNNCTVNRVKFVSALAQWMLSPNQLDDAPTLADSNLCRSCALELYGRLIELGATYTQDAIAIVGSAQGELQGGEVKPAPEFKH